MILINAEGLDQAVLNENLREPGKEFKITNCLGQRFIGAGMSGKKIEIEGIPGNALGAYLDGAEIVVHGNAQDAVGDTMNDGRIVINGNIGDAAGYAMRGGQVYVKGNAAYRAGIHMKAYKEEIPALVIGGYAGSFLGEYQAGGIIIVLGLDKTRNIVGNFPCTGMHGGKMFLRSDCRDITFPSNIKTSPMTDEDRKEAEPYIREYCSLFGCSFDEIINSPFTVAVPDSQNPYKQMYVAN